MAARPNGKHGGEADRIIGRQKAQEAIGPETQPVAPVDFVERRRHHEARQDKKGPDGVKTHMRRVARSHEVREHDNQREDEAKRSGQLIGALRCLELPLRSRDCGTLWTPS